MKTNDGSKRSVEEELSLLEQVVRERNAELRYFDYMRDNIGDFNIALATMPDDYIIRMYDYYIKTESRENFLTDEGEINTRLEGLRNMIVRLEEIPVIQEHMNSGLDEEAKVLIDNSVKTVVEKQKVRKMWPIQRFIYKRINRKK